MRVTYVTRSMLDYRVPVYESLSQKLDNRFHVIYNADYVPDPVNVKVRRALGDHAIGMTGEKRIGPDKFQGFANTEIRIVYQPGIMKQIAETNPDVLIVDGFFQWTSFALLYKLLHRIPLVMCYERTFHTERNVQWFRTVYRRAVVRFVDAMTCNGSLSLEYSKSLGMPASRITMGHMAADTENLASAVASVTASERQALSERWGSVETVFLVVGKLNKAKGIRELLLGWSLVEKNLTGRWRLVLLGAGPTERELKGLADELRLEGVIFHGPADYSDIAKYYASADVLVMPTLEDNWSLVVPEAMACGLPVLCSKYNGCYPELISPGENGWLFDPLDQHDTFQALKTCIENRSRLRKMGEKSRDIVASHTPNHAADAILNACKIAIQAKYGKSKAHITRP